MTALLPTRVSIYDFLIEDTSPIMPILADFGSVSIPQAKLIAEHGTQAIISALLAYHQAQDGETVIKKLLQRSQVKELRKFNAFNFKTMAAAWQQGQPISDTLFHSNQTQKEVCQHLALLTHLRSSQVKPILAALTVICLREIAILVDFAQLDAAEVDDWLNLQAQFLSLSRKETAEPIDTHELDQINDMNTVFVPQYDAHWHSITGYKPPNSTANTAQDDIPHYAKVIGRTATLDQDSTHATNPNNQTLNEVKSPTDSQSELTVTADNDASHSTDVDILTFSKLAGISLPYQRWLLQLAQICDTYLSRRRLKIAPEPKQAPSRPKVNFGFMQEITKATASEASITYDEPTPLWRNPILMSVLAVIGILSLLALGKYYYNQSNTEQPLPELSDMPDDMPSKDIAVIQIEEQ